MDILKIDLDFVTNGYIVNVTYKDKILTTVYTERWCAISYIQDKLEEHAAIQQKALFESIKELDKSDVPTT